MAVPAGIPTSGLQFCFDADQIGGVDNTTVGQLTDQSVNAWHAVQGTAASQGIFRASAINGKGGVEFDGASSSYPLPTAALGMFKNVGGGTCVAVLRDTGTLNATVGRRIFFASRGGSVAAGRLVMNHAEDVPGDNGGLMRGNTAGRRLDTDAVLDIFADNITNDPVARMSAIDWSGSKGYHYSGGKLQLLKDPFLSAGLTDITNSDAIRVGSNGTPSAFLPGLVCFVAAWNRLLTDAERSDISKYVQDKYAILQVDYPGVIYRPTSTIAAGGWTTTSTGLHVALSDQISTTVITGSGV